MRNRPETSADRPQADVHGGRRYPIRHDRRDRLQFTTFSQHGKSHNAKQDLALRKLESVPFARGPESHTAEDAGAAPAVPHDDTASAAHPDRG